MTDGRALGSQSATKPRTSGSFGASCSTQRREHRVEEHIGVLGVMHDVLELIRKEPRIDGVQHPSGAGHAVVELEMPVAVPGERRDAIAGARAERIERIGDPLRPGGDLGESRAMEGPFRIARNDFPSAVPGRRVVDEAGYQKRTLLHQSKHGFLPAARSAGDGLLLQITSEGGLRRDPFLASLNLIQIRPVDNAAA